MAVKGNCGVKVEAEEGGEYEEEYENWSSDSEIGDAVDWLDLMDDDVGGVITLYARRPNAHVGALSQRSGYSTLQPLSNCNQTFAHHIHVSPLEDWEGRFNVGMSNSVTTEIRKSECGMAIGETRNTNKADRATAEKANVYHATKSGGQELAIKVCKTSSLGSRTGTDIYKVTTVSDMDTPSTILEKWLRHGQRKK